MDEPLLGQWAARQRRLYRTGSLPEARIDALDELGFVWDPRQARWDACFDRLSLYFEEHGHCGVTASEDAALAAFALDGSVRRSGGSAGRACVSIVGGWGGVILLGDKVFFLAAQFGFKSAFQIFISSISE